MSRLISTAFALCLMLLSVTAAEAAGVRSFHDWNAVCDNSNTCVAFAFPAEGGGETAWLRLERGGDAGAPVKAVIAVYAEDDLVAGGGPWTVKVDGKPVAGLGALTPVQDGTGFWRAEVPDSSGRALAIAARDGSLLTLSRKSREPLTLSLAGGGATMIWIDEQQGRLGSPTALSRAPGRPMAIVAPVLPVIKAGPAISQADLPKTVPARVMAVLEDCEEPGDWNDEPVIARLAPGVVLYAPVCSRGAYNAVYSLVLADEKGGGARRLTLPAAPGSTEPSISDPMNIDYSVDARILVSFSKGRGIGDCGSEEQWVWDGSAFRLVIARVMSDCRGVPFDDWPMLYEAQVR
jgi:hypothetical protein